MAVRQRREHRNGLNALLALIAVCVLFFFLFGQQVTRNALFVPGPSSYEKDDSIHLVPARDETTLAVYWGPAPGATRTVFYFHGNGEDLGDVMFLLRNYQLQGVNVLAMDYRGYGLSEGSPGEKSSYRDALDVLAYAEKTFGVERENVVLHGRSLGGGVAMELATRFDASALILESTFLSAYRVYLPLQWIPGDKFLNYKKAKRVSCPVLLIHGREDGVVPFAHGEELAKLFGSNEPRTLWLEEAGHNDILTVAGSQYWSAIRAFLASF